MPGGNPGPGVTASSGEAPHLFDRALLTRRQTRAALTAREHDFLLRRIADDFCDRITFLLRDFPVGANIGAHHGVVSRRLREGAPLGWIIDLDPCLPLLAQCDGPRVLAHDDAPPLADSAFDLIVSALALHLVDDLPGALTQICRTLKPDGLFLGALLGGETLKELRESWIAAELELTGGASPRVAPCADVRTLGALLQRAGFDRPVSDLDTLTVTYASPLAVMADVKAMGASNMLVDRSRRPVTRGLLLRAAAIYAERFALADGRVSATFDIVTLTGRAPA